ncbi:MAG: protein phosphatase 2C domain-containing protein, partial [Clostridiales bacterium]|nr:protein phosphatase 2C domain-containing protein [Clostridiales bacterium]
MTKYNIAMKSVIGMRSEQQDCAFHKNDGEVAIAAVCDGMGGMQSGRLASEAAITRFKDLYAQKPIDESFPDFYLKIVDILDEFVFQMKDDNGEKLGAGTTFLSAAIKDNELFWLSVGDSRLYILRGEEFVQVTRDHNYFLELNRMLKENEISEEHFKIESAKGDALISFIGMGGIKIMDLNNLPMKLLPNDIVLLSTDGLYKALGDNEIKNCLRTQNIENALERLLNNNF